MAKLNFVPITNAIKEWIEDTGNDAQVNESILLRWATDVIGMVDTPELLCQRTTILNINNYKADLPEDFKLCCQAAANPNYESGECGQCGDGKPSNYVRTRREQIVQWKQDMMCADGCELEINLICPRCHSEKCSCDDKVVEVDVDRIWEQAHPELYYKNAMNYMRIGRWGYGEPGSVQNKFRLMKTSTNDFFNLKGVLGDCPGINCPDCYHTFRIKNNHIEVDFEKGEVLFSYLGKQLDEDGNVMIPNHPDMAQAIFWHLEHKYWWKDYRTNSKQASRVKYQDAYQQREIHLGLFRSAVEVPEFKNLQSYLKNQWIRRTHHWSSDSLGKPKTDPYLTYGSDTLADPNDKLYQRKRRNRKY